ncbi:hypothetical protein [Mycobacterium simulans]|uniref:hypothetical protein n=1 Tax=Mycobacterium simulans TaxID=627089 RepID=UPI00163E558A|nr:hypothetical protein [Mycobacterium simulans]
MIAAVRRGLVTPPARVLVGGGEPGVVVEEVADFRLGVIGLLLVCDIGLVKLVGLWQ